MQKVGKVSYYSPVAVKESQSSAEGGSGDAKVDCLGYDLPPRLLTLEDLLLEEVIEKKVLEVGVLVEGFLDVAKEHTE